MGNTPLKPNWLLLINAPILHPANAMRLMGARQRRDVVSLRRGGNMPARLDQVAHARMA
ncbi:hypothetical protein FHS79_001336 [Polymorphobacter multimanifer]|uniref:Uncharacterized protein n=1 Tax=Polymorphobacter multimanifer TaxID=1070431 RepID=A0A841LDE7_9SPHN|nr:hypothetical protein [Polymorphobacter multimanifer]